MKLGGNSIMVILHIAPISFNKSSGLSYAIPPLVSYQNKINNIKAALLLTSSKISEVQNNYDFPIYEFNRESIRYDLTGLPSPYNSPDLVVFHSTYIPTHFKIANHLKKTKIPYIITPHGGMTSGAQSFKKAKKKIGNLLFYNQFVKDSLALHCLSEGEFDETKFWDKKIFVVGNGMSLPNEFNNKVKEQIDSIRFTFIGRLDLNAKGLDLLLGGVFKSAENLRKSNGVFDVYGPDCSGSKSVIKRYISSYKIQDIVHLHEPVFGDAKGEILKQTDVFVHTSRFEGHPMAVLEAMAYGIPCLLTPGTNISTEVLQEDAGWEVQASEDSIAEGISTVIREKESLRIKGLNARNLIINKYSWENIAAQTVNEYKRLLTI